MTTTTSPSPIHVTVDSADGLLWWQLATLVVVGFTLVAYVIQAWAARQASVGQNFLVIRAELSSPEMRARRKRILRADIDGLPADVSAWPAAVYDDAEHVGQSFDTYGLLAKQRLIPRRIAVEFFGASAIRCFRVVERVIDHRKATEGWSDLWLHYAWFVGLSRRRGKEAAPVPAGEPVAPEPVTAESNDP